MLLTKDKRIRRNEAETTALMNAGVAAFVLTSGNLTGQQQGEAFAKALRRMQGMLRAHRVPFVATVTRDGVVQPRGEFKPQLPLASPARQRVENLSWTAADASPVSTPRI